MGAVIAGTGSYLPENLVKNQDLEAWMDTSDEWISTRTGIRERRISSEETGKLAAKAAVRALEDSGISAEELDWILAATSTSDHYFPGVAFQVQAEIGAVHAACADMGAACSGFLVALQTAAAYVESGLAKNVLVVAADTMSRLVDWKDRSTCVLFGDGAGAAILTSSDSRGVKAGIMGADGNGGSVLSCRTRALKNPVTMGWISDLADHDQINQDQMNQETAVSISKGNKDVTAQENIPLDNKEEKITHQEEMEEFLYMDGRRVFQFAVRKVPAVIDQVLEKSQWQRDEVDWFFLHQANERILTSIEKTLKISGEKVPRNLERCGNMAAASVPVLLDEWNRAGKLRAGDKMVLAGFGAGLSWGAMTMEWGKQKRH